MRATGLADRPLNGSRHVDRSREVYSIEDLPDDLWQLIEATGYEDQPPQTQRDDEAI